MADQYLAQTQTQRLQMVLAPQLRQSLELLQVPILELRTLVQQEMQQNPTLEEQLPETTQVEVEQGTADEKAVEPGTTDDKTEERKELDFKEQFEVLARLDDEWREYFQQTQASHHYTEEDAARRQYFFDSITQPESLQEHLLAQLVLTDVNEDERRIAELLIGSINDDGYLTTPIEEVAQTTGFDPVRLRELLEVIQEFDPIGVGACQRIDKVGIARLQRDKRGEPTDPVMATSPVCEYRAASTACQVPGTLASTPSLYTSWTVAGMRGMEPRAITVEYVSRPAAA